MINGELTKYPLPNAMAASLYNQLIWLVSTIHSAGRITKREIDQQWAQSPLNTSNEKVYPLRTFHRHREAISQMFGIYIGCDTNFTNCYYIANSDDLRDTTLRLRVLDTMALSSLLIDSVDLQKRVIFEKTNDRQALLSVVLRAMRDKCALRMEFKEEKHMRSVEAIPYCLQEKDHLWYLAAKPLKGDDNVEVQVYMLSDVKTACLTKGKQTMPRWFNGEVFFQAFFEARAPKRKAKTPAVPKEKPTKASKEKPVKEAKQQIVKKEKPAPMADQLSLF